MPAPAEEPLSRIHVQLFSSDLEILQSIFGDNIGYGPAIRKIVRSFLENNNVYLARRENSIEKLIV